ncbi:RHS repeat-associated core domain-containing protein [Sandaracinobacteroides saxicola]|uniref:RHS repeat-associated core domain-containing protein n=1 Tax=Sandaracinobacteroides saxicola TaxID=2759707 RepID=A0A7G5IIC3_9SPHN|nr:RHS repeat-associated core domain-containing protein [Sandaracinobacteroides saxicola]QMW23115.1 hypothetical protein H3309_00935 [Sandaracinobacteroides saxicola]
MLTDALGSVAAQADGSGQVATVLNSYGPLGEPGVGGAGQDTGRIRYTGQMWLLEVGVYHDKARAYSPKLGRFLQTDPIGSAQPIAHRYSYPVDAGSGGHEAGRMADDGVGRRDRKRVLARAVCGMGAETSSA